MGCVQSVPLDQAIVVGDETRVQKLLSRDPSARIKDGALRTAVKHNQAGMIQMLIQLGAHIDSRIGLLERKSVLAFASEKGFVEIVRILVSRGCNPDLVDSKGNTALLYASCSGDTNIIKYLSDKREKLSMEDVHLQYSNSDNRSTYQEIIKILCTTASLNIANKKGLTALLCAASRGDYEMVQLLVEGGARVDKAERDGCTPLIAAASLGHVETVQVLVTAGAGIDVCMHEGFTALIGATAVGSSDIVKILLDAGAQANAVDSDGNTALHFAVAIGDLLIFKLLSNAGAQLDVSNSEGKTPLMLAAEMGRTKMVTQMISKGVDLETTNYHGSTALFYAILRGRTDIVSILAQSGASMSVANSYMLTPLLVSIHCGHVEIFHIVLEAGADVNAADENGNTALILASSMGHDEMVLTLLNQNAAVNIMNAEGNSPLSVAILNQHQNTVALLLHAGACAYSRHFQQEFTPLMLSLVQQTPHIADTLLESGAHLDLNAVNQQGLSALSIAEHHGYHDTAKKIIALGGTPIVYANSIPSKGKQGGRSPASGQKGENVQTALQVAKAGAKLASAIAKIVSAI